MQDFNVTDFDIQALIDNELDYETEKTVMSYLDKDVKAKERYDTLKRQKKLLQEWWRNQSKN